MMNKYNRAVPDQVPFLQILSTIASPPKSLWYIGQLPKTRHPTVAIIGTRRPTAYGREVGYRLAFELAQKGVVIISGLALGLDSVAHQAAIDAGGRTIAVLPSGLDKIYPYSHRALATRIVAGGGALISEYAPGTQAFPSNFIARNRIVSGLADGVLVIEAAAKSGTMHTASFALEQGRAVMAVPGNITSPASAGCNNLIKTGATPITCTEDILHELGWQMSGVQPKLPLAATRDEQLIIDLLGAGTRDGDELQAKASLNPALFSQTLTMLEVTGKIRALGNNQWGLK